jgi:hypothetical protein
MGIATIRLGGEFNTPTGIGGNGHKVSGIGGASSEEANSEWRNVSIWCGDRLIEKNKKDMFKGSSIALESSHHQQRQ